MALGNNGHFQKSAKEGGYIKFRAFINRTGQVKT